jgi:hypothetical protein
MKLTLPILVFWLLAVRAAEARTRVEAYAGRPFGVGRVTVDLDRAGPLAPLGDDRFAITEADERVLYPVIQAAPVRRLLRDILDISAPRSATMYFLFRGDEPLDVTVFAPEGERVRVVPQPGPPSVHRDYLDRWWAEYTTHYRNLAKSGEYPLLVQNYLITTLARRLDLPLPESGAGLFRRDDVNRTLGLLLGTESIRAALQKELLLGDVRDQPPVGARDRMTVADRPLPPPVQIPAVRYPVVPEDVAIEPIAMHVPHECFYVRFGDFRNYLWLRDLTKQWGGDLANMIAVRSIDYGANARIERQLALKESALAAILGPAVIQDVAILGTDTFLRQGAAVGILFHARNNFGLANDIRRQRREALASREDATDVAVQIAGRDVSYLSTPQGEIRSYYVQDGDFHLVTTSRYIARRFLETGAGDAPLGGSDEFRYARSMTPITRDDTVFAYFSDAFMRQLAGPHYRIEMTRRTRSLVEIENVRIAPLAARAEGLEDFTTDDLVATGFLPRGFGRRADGSELIGVDGQWVDSLRGATGTFVPIPDVAVESVTAAEAADYEAFRRTYEGDWKAVDPVMATVSRTPRGAGVERITIDLMVSPVHEASYGMLARNLGPPTTTRLARIPGDVATLEAHVRVGAILDPGAPKRVHHVFGSLRDFRSPLVVRQGDVRFAGAPAEFIRGYLGSSPPLRILDIFLPTEESAIDEDGFLPPRPPGDAWQRRWQEMAVFSFKRDVLESVTPQLAQVEAERPAQIRLRIDDLSDKAVSELVNAFGYKLARSASGSATRFMNSLNQQLHVPRPESRAVAEELIGGTFVCPLGGEYELVEVPGALPTWVSTAMTPQNRWLLIEVPDDYQLPLLAWFRGLAAELNVTEEVLQAHLEIDVATGDAAANGEQIGEGLRLPAFSLPFGGTNKRPVEPGLPKEVDPLGEAPPPPPLREELPPPRPDNARQPR